MRSVKRVLSFAFALMMVLAVLPMSGKASGGADLYVIVAEGGTITAQGAGSFESGQASEGTVLSISLDPAAFPEYTFDHWESVYGDRIPQESFRLLVDQDAYFFPVFSDVVAHFGEWELVRHGETCEDGDIYKRTDPETGLVEYGFMMRNYGSHDFGDYEYLDEDHCAAVCRYCGYVDVQEHSWSSGEVIREATHTTPGIVHRTCYRCGATVDTDIGTT